MESERETGATPPEETFDDLYENAPCGYLTANADDVVERVNGTILRWLGVTRDTVVGQRIRTLLSPAGRIFFETHVAPTIVMEGAAHQVAIDLACADGGRLHVLTDWQRIDIDGAAVGVRAMLVDATDRRAYERDLIEARERAQAAVLQLRASERRLREGNETL